MTTTVAYGGLPHTCLRRETRTRALFILIDISAPQGRTVPALDGLPGLQDLKVHFRERGGVSVFPLESTELGVVSTRCRMDIDANNF